MKLLTRDDLLTLEKYAVVRPEFRARVMEYKKLRRVPIGSHVTLYFEGSLTMQYQIQEMLRVERIFEPEAIEEELRTYNPLIPDGSNWKATLMIEYEDVEERKIALSQLIGIEKKVWVKIDGLDRIFPIANEDLVRETTDKTSAVHFLRFELNQEMRQAARGGATVAMGIVHPCYNFQINAIDPAVRDSLVEDLE